MKRLMTLICLTLATVAVAQPASRPASAPAQGTDWLSQMRQGYVKLYQDRRLGEMMADLHMYRMEIFSWKLLVQMYGSPAETALFDGVYNDAMKLEGDMGKAYKTTGEREVKALLDRFAVLKIMTERIQQQVPEVLRDILKYRKLSMEVAAKAGQRFREGKPLTPAERGTLLAQYADALNGLFSAEQKALRRRIEFVRDEIKQIEDRIARQSAFKDQQIAAFEKMLAYEPKPKTPEQIQAEREAVQKRIDWMKSEIERLEARLSETRPATDK
jgi:hypothetical protein